MNEPPTPLPANPFKPPQNASLATILSQLTDLVFNISLPKTKASKSTTLALNTLHHAHDLISACMTLEDHHKAQILSIHQQLEAISSQIFFFQFIVLWGRPYAGLYIHATQAGCAFTY